MKIVIRFSKMGEMRLISHLDLMRLFARAVRRAALPVALTKGFNPHPRISVSRALKLGLESASEEAVFHLDRIMAPAEFKERLNKQLPEGIRIKDAKTDPD